MKRLGENVKLRLLSVFIALILCVYVMNIQNPEIKKDFEDIPVKLTSLGYDLALASEYNYTATVKVKGQSEIVKKLTKADIQAVADLESYNKTGIYTVPLKIEIPGVEGVEITEKNPTRIELALEKFTSKSSVVDVKILGQKSDARYDIKSIRPNLVTVSGPENLINSIGAVRVFIDVANHEKDISLIKNYRIINKNNKDITENVSLIKDNQGIQVEIDYSKVAELPVVADLKGQVADGYYISEAKVSPERIAVYGDTNKVIPLKEIRTSELNISGLTKDLSKNMKLSIPTGVNIEDNNTVKVNVLVKKEDVKSLDISSSDINFVNSSGNYSYQIVKPQLRLQLVGRNGALNTLDPSKLGLYIDVDGLLPGTHSIKVNMKSNSNIRLGDNNSKVKIKISKK